VPRARGSVREKRAPAAVSAPLTRDTLHCVFLYNARVIGCKGRQPANALRLPASQPLPLQTPSEVSHQHPRTPHLRLAPGSKGGICSSGRHLSAPTISLFPSSTSPFLQAPCWLPPDAMPLLAVPLP